MWRGGRKCGRGSKPTRDDDARHGGFNPVVRTKVSEILWLKVLSRPRVWDGFGDHLAGLLVEPFVEVPSVLIRSGPFVCV